MMNLQNLYNFLKEEWKSDEGKSVAVPIKKFPKKYNYKKISK